MKSRIVSIVCAIVLFVSCRKKEAQSGVDAVGKKAVSECKEEVIASKPVKVGETGLVLPVGTKICITKDASEVRVELPAGYAFITQDKNQKTLPTHSTYTCICSAAGTACQVFYADGWGFGCLQSSCTGSCTGKFTYGGYTVDKVVSTSNKTDFFSFPEVSKLIEDQCKYAGSTAGDYVKLAVYGVSFFMVTNETKFMDVATCKCEGTQACKLKSLGIGGYKIYYCEGTCNGCELTVK